MGGEIVNVGGSQSGIMVTLRSNLQSKMETASAVLMAAITAAINSSTANLQRYVVTEKLSGQMLRRITGTLADSVRMAPAAQTGDTIVGSVLAGGGVASYALVQERGGDFAYEILPKNAQALAWPAAAGADADFVNRSVSAKQKIARASARGVNMIFARRVIHPPLPARPFLSTSAQECIPKTVEIMETEISKACEGLSTDAAV